jgi:hypothetical protein
MKAKANSVQQQQLHRVRKGGGGQYLDQPVT